MPLKPVFRAESETDAQLLKGLLASEGMDCEIVWEDARGPFGMAPIVCVAEEDYDRAFAITTEYAARKPAAENPFKWRCAGCGELVEEQFGACWKCGRGRPER